MRLLWLLELHRKPPLEIRDLGMGCGHFDFAAERFGHVVSGIDLPASSSRVSQFYSEYRALLGLACEPWPPHI